ncbi:hypothetical protein PHIN3_366 [Sinorhizobium phage phiN3]|uniref:Uncharacterized protein n=1 Tax=Sinorhizobium phage phiN3 TaxID=1647405 RepID=A0A0F6YQ94_9CAUD|nr:hypothetical protein AVT40_gp167 [Sinorhizobium phage phiN3]AKF13629.1 hypothetical protein PHIN3_366 [Sinorhizobium phage phiN3]
MKSLTDELNQLRLVAFMTNKETDKEAYYKALSHAFQNGELVSKEHDYFIDPVAQLLHSFEAIARSYHALMHDKHNGYWNFDQDMNYQTALKEIEKLRKIVEGKIE